LQPAAQQNIAGQMALGLDLDGAVLTTMPARRCGGGYGSRFEAADGARTHSERLQGLSSQKYVR